MRIRVSARKVAGLMEELRALALRRAVGEYVFEEAARRTHGHPENEALRERWRRREDRRAVRLVSKLNRTLWGDAKPPADPMAAVAEAVVNLPGRRVPWRDAREWLMSMWGWAEEMAEFVLLLGSFDVLPLRDPEQARGLGVPERERPVRVHGTREPGLPDLDWYLTLRPSKVERVRVEREVRP